MRRILILATILSMNSISCQEEFPYEAIYISVVGDYGVPFKGTYGNALEWHDVSGVTPEYYPFESVKDEFPFMADFSISVTTNKTKNILVVLFYLQEYGEPLRLIARHEISDPDSSIIFTYPE